MSSLPFDFTPVDPPGPDPGPNPHAQQTTYCPEAVAALQAHFGESLREVNLYANEHCVVVDAGRIAEVGTFLRDELGFTCLVDLGGTDRFTEDDRFEVFYNFVSIAGRKRLRVKVRVGEEDPVVPTVSHVFRSANWYERETFDMFGIRFDGHEDLRRMYMPEDYEYHPLRKEFPLLGIPGSLPLPPQTPGGRLTMDPFAAARGSKPIKSYEEQDEKPSRN
jgi:NADH-quinone oxidoreductase subunit C